MANFSVQSVLGTWSYPAALRALRAAVVIPSILALTSVAIGNPQMALYAVFGSFANLVLVSFAGSRPEKLIGHAGLGIAGSVLLTIGTAVHASAVAAGLATLVVAGLILLSGLGGPNIAAGSLGAMLSYVLAAASPGTMSMVPDRLAGWWMATGAAAAAVVLLSPPRAHEQLRATAAASARALGLEVQGAASGAPEATARATSQKAEDRLRAVFNASPYRPTGWAIPDQALNNLIQLLGWVGALVGDVDDSPGLAEHLNDDDSAVLRAAGHVLVEVADMLEGGDVTPDLGALEHLRSDGAQAVRALCGRGEAYWEAAHASFHAQTIALAVRGAALDALIATGRASAQEVAQQRIAWLPHLDDGPVEDSGDPSGVPRHGEVVEAVEGIVWRHASIRSVWARNSARGAIAVAVAVTVADLTNVQHGFWLVLGTLSVLRTTASATGGTAMRAILGSVLGFAVGAGIVLGLGTSTVALWVALPIAVLLASYLPGVAPFALGQAAFTVMLLVLYNILVPVGWKVGVVRVEDIAAGCGISLLVGTLFWPRGAVAVVADDLHDAFATASAYLNQAAEWALGFRDRAPDGARDAVVASLRLDDALRAFLTEQGTKAVSKEDLWSLVGAAQRVRLTAAGLAELPNPAETDAIGQLLSAHGRDLSDWYLALAAFIRRGPPPLLPVLDRRPPPDLSAAVPAVRGQQAYIDQHLRHLHRHQVEVIAPASRLGEALQRPWWKHRPADQGVGAAALAPAAIVASPVDTNVSAR